MRVLGLSKESASLVRPLGDLGTPTLSAKGALWPYGLLSTHWKFIRRMLLCDVVQFVVEVVHLNKQRTSIPEKFGERLVG